MTSLYNLLEGISIENCQDSIKMQRRICSQTAGDVSLMLASRYSIGLLLVPILSPFRYFLLVFVLYSSHSRYCIFFVSVIVFYRLKYIVKL